MSTLQIQTVLYNNTKNDIIRSLDSIKKAIEVSCFYTKEFDDVKVSYGDASPIRLFSDAEIHEINKRYNNIFTLYYTYFNYNTGTAKGHNLLGKDCKTDYMMIMNPDILMSPRLLINVIKPFKNVSFDVGLVESRQTPIEHPKYYDINTGETSWASTACVIFKTETFHEVHGFDEKTFFMYCDDVDFSWRIRLLGKKIIYQPLAPVFHAKRLSAKGGWQATSAEVYYSAEAALLMAYKWSNEKLLAKLLLEFKASRNDNLIKAANNFEMRREKNSLPQQLDKEHKVAAFVNGNYTKHRFAL